MSLALFAKRSVRGIDELEHPEFSHPSGRDNLQPFPVLIDSLLPQYVHYSTEMLIQEADLTEKHIRRNEIIPLDFIVSDDGPVSEEKVKSVSLSVQWNGEQREGQRENVTISPRIGRDGIIRYFITNGYHRVNAFKNLGYTHVDVTVLYGYSDEEIFDLRVEAAADEKSIRFTRVATWMNLSYEQTEWFARRISLKQLLNIAATDTKKSSKTELTREETEQAKEWIKIKAKKWKLTLSGIREIIDIAEDADPLIIVIVKTEGGGKIGHGIINPARLKVMVEALPKDFRRQQLVKDAVLQYNFEASDTRILSQGAARVDGEALLSIFRDPVGFIHSEKIREGLPEQSAKRLTRHDLENEKIIFLERLRQEEERVETVLRETATTLAQRDAEIETLTTQLRSLAETYKLESLLPQQHPEFSSSETPWIGPLFDQSQWWNKTKEITLLEKIVASLHDPRRLKYKYPRIGEILGIPENTAQRYFESAERKYQIFQEENTVYRFSDTSN